jgi:hypothetical protein
VPPEPPADVPDPGRVSRVGRESWDMKWSGLEEPCKPAGLYAIDRCQPTGGSGAPKDGKCWPQYTFGVGTFARIDKRPPTLFGRLTTRSVRVHPDRKGLPRSA